MSIRPQVINKFLESKVRDGSCSSVIEAEKEVMSQLIRRDLEREIAIGDKQIENGEYDILDDNYIEKFIADIEKTILSKNV